MLTMLANLRNFCYQNLKKKYKELVKTIKTKLELDDASTKDLKKAFDTIKTNFIAELEK